jgi:hypothetical protein
MEPIKCITFDKNAQDNLPEHIKAKMKADREKAEREQVKIVCYCGSLKFKELFEKFEYESVFKGEIALLPCCMFVDIEREYGALSDYKQKADEQHKRKIDICDEVFVINKDGYIGESTRSEIEYAIKIGKPIKYLNMNFLLFKQQVINCMVFQPVDHAEFYQMLNDWYAFFKEQKNFCDVPEWCEDFFQDVDFKTHTYMLKSKAIKRLTKTIK